MSAVGARPGVHAPRAIAVIVMAVGAAFLVQTSVLPAVGLSAAVPVVFAVIVVLGVSLGTRAGALTGFLAGLLVDLSGIGTLGVGALLGCLAGAAAGRVRVDRWWLSGVPSASALTVLAALLYAGMNAALAGLPIRPGAVWWTVAGGVLCTALLLPARDWVREVVR